MRLTRLFRILAMLFWIAAVVCLLSCGWSWVRDVNAWETPYRMAWHLRLDRLLFGLDYQARHVFIGVSIMLSATLLYWSRHATRRDLSI